MSNMNIRVNGRTLRGKTGITMDKEKCSIQMPDGKTYEVDLKKNIILIGIFGDLGEKILKNVYELDN